MWCAIGGNRGHQQRVVPGVVGWVTTQSRCTLAMGGTRVGVPQRCCWDRLQQHGLCQEEGQDPVQLLQLLLDTKSGPHLQPGDTQPLLLVLDHSHPRLVLHCSGDRGWTAISSTRPHAARATSDIPRLPVLIPTSEAPLPPLLSLVPLLLGSHCMWWCHCCCPGWALCQFCTRPHTLWSRLICGRNDRGTLAHTWVWTPQWGQTMERVLSVGPMCAPPVQGPNFPGSWESPVSKPVARVLAVVWPWSGPGARPHLPAPPGMHG